MLVKLQRPPPDISIFLPILFDFSSTTTWRPRLAAVNAHIKPAAPAPRTITLQGSVVDEFLLKKGPVDQHWQLRPLSIIPALLTI